MSDNELYLTQAKSSSWGLERLDLGNVLYGMAWNQEMKKYCKNLTVV